MTKGNSKIRWISFGFTVLVIVTAVIASFVWAQADIKAVNVKADGIKENVGLLKTEGCKPANKAKNDMAVFKVAVQKDISAIQEDVDTMQKTQNTAFREILRRLPE